MAQAEVIFRGNASSLESSATAGAAAVTRVEQAGKRVGPAMAGASREVEGFGKRVRGMAALTLGTLGAAELVKGVKDSINAAGDLEKQQRKVIRVFGDTPHVLEAFEKTAAKAYGVSHLAALKAATSTGALLTNLGVGQKAAAGMSVGVIKLTSDMASFNGLPTEQVLKSVNSALLGQTRGLKSLGISLSAADVNAKALALGLVKPTKSADGLRAATDKVTVAEQKYGIAVRDHGKGSKEALSAEAGLIAANKTHAKAIDGIVPKLTAQQKAVATLALIYDRSKVQQGDFGRNSETLANQQKTLDAEFSNLSDRLGKDLTPAMKTFVEFMAGPGISGAGHFLTTIESDSKKVYSAVQPLAPVAHAAADAFGAIAHQDGVIPTIIGIGAAYKGTTLALRGGQSAYLSAASAIGNLANPFRTVSTAAADAGNVMVGAGFTGKVVSAASIAEKEAPSFLGLANPIGAIATVAGLAAGALILLATTSESAGDKARKARDDFLGLVDAVNKVKSTKLDVKQTALDVSRDQASITKFSPALVSAKATAHQAFPDTPQGDREAAAAKQRLNEALRTQDQNYINLARDRQRHADAVAAESKAEADAKKRAEDTGKAIEGLGNKLLDTEKNYGALGARVNRTVAEQGAVGRAVVDVGKQFDHLITTTKGISPVQREALGAIKTFVAGALKETGKIPSSKTLKILLQDAASGQLNKLRAELALLQNKTIVVTTRTSNPIAGGGRSGAATSAWIGGTWTGVDSVPVTVAPGEVILNPHAIGLIDGGMTVAGALQALGAPTIRSGGRYAGSGGPGGALGAQEAAAIANTPAKTVKAKRGSSRRGSSKKPDNRPAWMKHWQDDLGSKLPDDDKFANAVARAQADLDDASRTSVKSDDARALHTLIRLAMKRLPALHAMRGTHKEAVWQTAVNSEISSVSGQLAGYWSSLSSVVKKPGPDDITVGIPSGIRWGIESAGFTDKLSDDVTAQGVKRRWLLAQLNAKDKHGRYKIPLKSAKRIAFQRDLARTNAELTSLGSQQTQATQAAADQAAQDAATPPDLPIGVQQVLADAALTPGTADDWMALELEKQTIEGQLAAATNPTVQVALKQALAGVNSQIDSLTSASSSGGSGGASGPTPDQTALLTQSQARLALATRSVAVGEQELRTFAGSGDIGTSRYGSALDAARNGPQVVLLGDARSAMVAANWFTQGAALQPSTTSTRLTGVATL